MKKIFFLDTVHPVLSERLTQSGEYECIEAHDWTKEQCETQLATAHGLVIRSRFTMDESFLQFIPDLQFIARSGAGMENIDVSYCNSHGIKLYNAPEGNRNAVGEHALGMLLSMMNKIHTANRDVKTGSGTGRETGAWNWMEKRSE
jgi:D-3-phosphoglycerate dehydrogenase